MRPASRPHATDLQFLISDRGVHFPAHQFARHAKEQDFVHVLIARHRPESNGIVCNMCLPPGSFCEVVKGLPLEHVSVLTPSREFL